MPINESLQFDELYTVSDLHLGGVSGFQIFGSTPELVRLLTILTGRAESQRVAFVINGDFVDFLAESPSRHFDPEFAVAKLERVIRDEKFLPIFVALQAFLKSPQGYLLINLGNHDLELALPWVHEHFSEWLCQGSPASYSRLKWCLDGTGIRCKIGCADVLLLHGNEFDPWNVTDYHRLRTLTRQLQFGLPVAPWKPNAGSRMVVEVMNKIKESFPFVDLLKPEIEGVVKALPFLTAGLGYTLDAGTFAAIALKDEVRMRADVLSGGSDIDPPTGRQYGDEADFLEQLEQGKTDILGDDVLGLIAAALSFGKSRAEKLRRAILEVSKDQSFDLANRDPTYLAASAKTASDIHFLITGHTHLLRAIPRSRGAYYNSGTWARLVQVLPEYLRDEASFDPVYRVMTAPNMAVIDAVEDAQGRFLAKKLCPVVRIMKLEDKVVGDIVQVGTADPVPIPGTRFPASE